MEVFLRFKVKNELRKADYRRLAEFLEQKLSGCRIRCFSMNPVASRKPVILHLESIIHVRFCFALDKFVGAA